MKPLSERIKSYAPIQDKRNWAELQLFTIRKWADEVAKLEDDLERHEAQVRYYPDSYLGKIFFQGVEQGRKQLEADIGECSICGNKPALCVDKQHKGTYWLCAECMMERIEDKMQLEAEVERFRKYLSVGQIARFAFGNGRREVHRSWRDTMLSQNREVSNDRMSWETLSPLDKLLDEQISFDVIKDYSTWVLGNIALEAGEEDISVASKDGTEGATSQKKNEE